MRIALFQPEIPQNTGTLLRLGACLNVGIDVIEPCGFVWNDQKLRRAGMDYLELSSLVRYSSWTDFIQDKLSFNGRIVLVDVEAPLSFLEFSFHPDDILLMGQESCGVPSYVLEAVPYKVKIPMVKGRRSLNMAVAASMVVTEALRQTHLFPEN